MKKFSEGQKQKDTYRQTNLVVINLRVILQ